MPELPKTIRIWLVEDNDRFRTTLARAISAMERMECPCHFNAAEPALGKLQKEQLPPDVLMLDIGLPGIDGIAALPQFQVKAPDMKIIILTVFDDHDRIFRALCTGADGYLLKQSSMEQIEDAVHEVMAGGASMSPQIARKVLNHFAGKRKTKQEDSLTDKEVSVLELLVKGLTKAGIAGVLKLSEHTVDSRLRNIYRKLHVNNRASAVAAAIRDGLISGATGLSQD